MILASNEIIAWCELAGFTTLAELLKEKAIAGQTQIFSDYEVQLIDDFRIKINMSTLTEYVTTRKGSNE